MNPRTPSVNQIPTEGNTASGAARILRGSERFAFTEQSLPTTSDGAGHTTRIRRSVSGNVAASITTATGIVNLKCTLCHRLFSAEVRHGQGLSSCVHCGTLHRISVPV